MAAQTEQRLDWAGALRVDYVLLGIVAGLLIIGLIMVWSVTFAPNVGQLPSPQSDFIKQAGYALVGLIILFALARIDYHVWGRAAILLMVIAVCALIALLFTTPINGARRWLLDGSIQPSEFAKFAMIVYMARWLSSKGEKLRNVTYGLLPFGIIVGAIAGLVMLQPNLSTAIIIGLCALAMFFIAGADAVQFALLLIVGGVSTGIVIFNMPHALERFTVFLQDPFALAGSEGYQIAETLIALGSGGLLGRGIGSGYAKFGYVPAPHTDSIFALLGEEMGLVGTWIVLALYLFLVYRGFRIAARATDPFGQVLAAGLTFWLIFQAFVNIAVVTATIPFTGVPLPFISFGGSALIAALAAVGVLLNISRSASAAKEDNATFNFGWRDRGTRVPRANGRRRDAEPSSRSTRARSR
jgi:cell division protein FtsW